MFHHRISASRLWFLTGFVMPALLLATPVLAQLPAPNALTKPIFDSVPESKLQPLPGDFIEQIENSPLTHAFARGIADRGWVISYESGFEIFAKNVGPDTARFAMVPLLNADGFGEALYSYTYDTVTGKEGSEVVTILTSDDTNTLRAYVHPSFEVTIDLVVDKEGYAVDAAGVCPIARGVGDEDSTLAETAEESCGYWRCVLDRVVRMALLGQQTGLSQACMTACSAGGLANPVCAGCLAAGIVVLFGIWWDC